MSTLNDMGILSAHFGVLPTSTVAFARYLKVHRRDSESIYIKRSTENDAFVNDDIMSSIIDLFHVTALLCGTKLTLSYTRNE